MSTPQFWPKASALLRPGALLRAVLQLVPVVALLILLSGQSLRAEPGAHDPSRMIQNVDGRYWIFTTGTGIYAMSSANVLFTSGVRTESPVFKAGTWPSWINSYVSGFGGNFWAPDVIKIGSTFYCYYSCAGNGAPAAIGLATATNLAGPWTDKGWIANGNNAIDPAPIINGSYMYLAYGNWQSGIDLIELSPTTGKRLNTYLWRLIADRQVEAPYIMKNGSYFYLFFQSGLCCNGCSSGYYTRVGRSTSIFGPYVDKSGVALSSGGGTTFLVNKSSNIVGPGHVGYGCGKLTFHFYNANASCAPQLRIRNLTWGSDGWPVAN